MPLLKPFRALRYDVGAAGPLDTLVAPPYDVIAPAELERFVAGNPYNVVRLIRPYEPALAAERFRAWQEEGVLVREERPALWRLEEEYVGPDGVRRVRNGLVGRVRLDPSGEGVVLPHERTFSVPVEARLQLLRAVGAKLSPIFLLHAGGPPAPVAGEPDLEASLGGVTSRLCASTMRRQSRRMRPRSAGRWSSPTGITATRRRCAITRRIAARRRRTCSPRS